MNKVEFNMNDRVEVELTQFGAQVYNQYYADLKEKYGCIKMDPKHAGEILKEQIWSLMQMYGEHIYMGMSEVPFKGNKMTLLRAKMP